MKRIRSVLANTALLIVTGFAIAVGGELITRAFFDGKIGMFPRFHTDAQYGEFTLRKLRPNFEFWHSSEAGSWKFTTNKQGFRNYKDFAYTKPKGVVRILSLGDSHTEGIEVRQEYTFSAVIERYLNQRGINAEVINSGVSGFSTAEELLFLENEGIRYAPDVVVLGFFANDFEDNCRADLFRLSEDGKLEIKNKSYIPGVGVQNVMYELPFANWLSQNSYCYTLCLNTAWEYFKKKRSTEASIRAREYAIPIEDNPKDYMINLTAALIKRMYEFCNNNNIKLIIIDIPNIRTKNGAVSAFSSISDISIEGYNDAYVDGPEQVAQYEGIAELRVPHGQYHISEFTHILLGMATAREIIQLIE